MNVNENIEITNLKPDSSLHDIEHLCTEAVKRKYRGVCTAPIYTQYVVKYLANSGVKTITVIGFPSGFTYTNIKVEEAKKAIEEGADELDYVINITAVKSARWTFLENEIQSLRDITQFRNKVLKVIIEIGLLTNDEIKKVISICNNIKVDYIKTSTGVYGSGATAEQVKLIKKLADKQIKIKASGGIKTLAQATELLHAGSHTIGTSALL